MYKGEREERVYEWEEKYKRERKVNEREESE